MAKEKAFKRRRGFYKREEQEAEIRKGFELIYPLVSYKQDFFIQDVFEEEEKKL